jgi:hypothetical protein
MKVRAAGNVTPGVDTSSPQITFTLAATKNASQSLNPSQQPSSAPSLTFTNLFAYQHAAAGLGIVTIPWAFEATVSGDSTSGILQGLYTFVLDGVVVESNVATTLVTGVNFAQPTPLAFALGVTFDQSGSGNTASLYMLDLDM